MSYHSDVAHNMYRFYTQLSLLFFPDLTLGGQSAERVSTDGYTRKESCVGIEIAGGSDAGLRVCYASLIQLPPTTSELSSPVTVTVPTLIYNPYFRRTSTHNYIFRLLQPLN